MANAFLEYYRFNTKIAPDRTVFIRTENKSGKSFQEYAQRWQDLAAQVQTPMTENEMTKWFIDNFKPPYYEKCWKNWFCISYKTHSGFYFIHDR